jgi:hypothetical protein
MVEAKREVSTTLTADTKPVCEIEAIYFAMRIEVGTMALQSFRTGEHGEAYYSENRDSILLIFKNGKKARIFPNNICCVVEK